MDLTLDLFGCADVQEADEDVLLLANEPEEQVFGVDDGRAYLCGFVAGEEDRAASFFGETFEHRCCKGCRAAPDGSLPEFRGRSFSWRSSGVPPGSGTTLCFASDVAHSTIDQQFAAYGECRFVGCEKDNCV